MSTVTSELMSAVASWLSGLPALSGFTVSDRPAPPNARPHLRLGPLERTPWNTASSEGARCAITLTFLTDAGSFASVQGAVEAICAGFDAMPAVLTDGTVIHREVSAARFDHDARHDSERASLRLIFLIDLGDRP
ncbi:MAG: DUF3168 domain-containing protein [Devosiaceae bacterium]|nr:DUF3168 domain-containing protein [Devosiaceae bacterium MH13]